MTHNAGQYEFEDQRAFFGMTPGEREMNLWMVTRSTARQVADLTKIVKEQSVGAWWGRARDFLVFATPIAGLAWLMSHG